MYAYIEEFSGGSYVAEIETDPTYQPTEMTKGVDPETMKRIVGRARGLRTLTWDSEIIQSVRHRDNVGQIYYNWPSNRCVEISEAEYQAITEADRAALDARREARNREKIEELSKIIADAEKQADIPTPAEARAREAAYNARNNEGGYGYVPHIIDSAEYAAAQDKLARLIAK